MPERPYLNFRGGQSQPRMFFTLCLLFSLVIVIVTVYFIYNPENSVSNGVYNIEQHARRPALRSELHGLRESRLSAANSIHGGDVLMDLGEDNTLMSNQDMDYHHHKSASAGDGENEEIVNQPRIRHHNHHHGKPGPTLEELEQRSLLSNVIETRLLHFDLKGAQPRIPFLKEVMKLAKKAGINGLLIEWEDSFPWTKSLANASMSEGTYTREEVQEIVDFAELVLDFEVIPLVQTFGHVEFILKGPEFRHLREVDSDPQAFCPSKPETMKVVKTLIDQILDVHKRSRFLHIGCDEVFNLRVCPVCTAATEFKEDLFLKHVTDVATYVKKQGKVPLIWDDMLRIVSLKKLTESGIGQLVEPMVWVYAEDVDRFVGWEAWEKYADVFPTIWGAAAFKGAFGETLSIPPLSRHADNVDRWISVITRESPKWNLGTGGLVLTGWQRYDHFSVLCELLPAGVPSIVYNGLQMSIPWSSAAPIKNRIFVPINQEPTTTSTTLIRSSKSASQVSFVSYSSSEKPFDPALSPHINTHVSSSSPPPPSHISKRSPSHRRNGFPPRILMVKDRLARLAQHPGGSHSRDLSTAEIYDKFDLVSREFSQIMHCPNAPTRLDALLKGSDNELNFASRCNFPGVAFFRALFRLKPTLVESWELIEKIERKRGWAQKYNIRHNYSLPLRVDEVIFADVPRLRRQLESSIKGIETSLKPVFRQEIILEWIEQNVWEAWKALRNLEKAGDILKNIHIWKPRPVQSPWEMVEDLKLSRIDQEEL